ncbi:tyrosine recombinase XerC [Roseobacter cerasinus]|uniref:Tyrosine recombinase XerC n=1 Tax=Roseobacter cerasinus TaxID=2602289 RepID=A0A640VZ05_9RHOB|nr:DUF484 family protein [Roseobacter cerasinus]GFE51476.1 tyrosine recombinase XerC [Roseobacter cerasinus]
MSSEPKISDAVRAAILSQPNVILNDPDVMNALVAANERAMGSNVVDLRGIAMDRMETRLDQLEDTHRSVIAAAYENVAGTQQIHRAILRLLDPADLDTVLDDLGGPVADILRVDAVRLVLETADNAPVALQNDHLALAPQGFVAAYLGQTQPGPSREVTLRPPGIGAAEIYGQTSIASEACLVLDLGMPGLLLLGSKDGQMFGPQQGTDLLAFLGGVVERVLRRLLP